MAATKADSVAREFRVALVAMPWTPFNRPSLQLSVLQAYLQEQLPGVAVSCHHHYLEVAQALGPAAYYWLALSGWGGEALYAPSLFSGQKKAAARLYGNEARRFAAGGNALDFEVGCALVTRCLDAWLTRQPLAEFDLVGFSVCFNQLVPALLAARRLKELRPELPLVFGGSACGDREMAKGLLAAFPQVDYVVCGEGEVSLSRLVAELQAAPDRSLGGSLKVKPAVRESAQVERLDSLPQPDFGSYFHELKELGGAMNLVPELPVEFSRGCWWGHCSFCNLNLQWCGYRRKSASRMVAEVRHLASTYGCLDFFFADNVLPVAESRVFFQEMAETATDFRFFAEMRGEQGADLEQAVRGGLTTVQVGIEALSTGLLARMRKGGSVIANLALMKRALACGLQLEGNLITEFPGTTPDEVTETLAALDFAWPFAPLHAAGFFLGHGSPMARQPEDFGIKANTVHPKARGLYPPETLALLPLLVQGYRGDLGVQRRLWRPVHRRLRQWRKFHHRRPAPPHLLPPLSYRDGGDFLLLRQETADGQVLHHRLRGLSRRLYLACGEVRELDDLVRDFPDIARNALVHFLDEMAGKRLLFREGKRVLALAVRARRQGVA